MIVVTFFTLGLPWLYFFYPLIFSNYCHISSSTALSPVKKFSLICRLYEQGLQEKDIRNLYRFIDWVMMLPKALEADFWQDFKQFEQERTMTYITTGEGIGYERGIAEGKQEGEQNLVVRLLQKWVGNLPEEIRKKIQTLSLNQLESLGEAWLDFTAIEDLLNWLESHQ